MTNLQGSFLKPEWGAPPSIRAFVSSRAGGVSAPPYDSLNLGDHVGDLSANVIKNRGLLRGDLPSEPLWLNQVHGTAVSTPSARITTADAIVSNISGEVLAIMTADCLPVLFASKSGTIIGASHAGWRGLCAGVLEHTVSEMRKLAIESGAPGTKEIVAWLGPAIGPKAFEVGEDVVQAFDASGIPFSKDAFIPAPHKPGKFLANIYSLAQSRLNAVGVREITGGSFCTVTQDDQFFSYRRDGVTGRFASLLWIDPSQ